MIILGIETSCDETAVAVVTDQKQVLGSTVLSQLEDHRPFGGVVPEIAARAHLSHLPKMIASTLEKANCTVASLDAVAATIGPGLIGGLVVGSTVGKALAWGAGKPFLGINHLEGHALSPRLIEDIEFPYLLLLVSGGHTQLLVVKGVGQYELLGTTIDDAVGEAFDKVAKMMDLAYPGGPKVEKLAQGGQSDAYAFPRPLKKTAEPNFSFSGLKTAVRYALQKEADVTEVVKKNIAASFQQAVAETLVDRIHKALEISGPVTACIVAGGVAANQFLRMHLEEACAKKGLPLIAPPLALCTDNGEMIAWAGIERFKLGLTDGLEMKPRPRWPLMEVKHD